jgi:hypothetical protein
LADDNSGLLHIDSKQFANCVRQLLIFNEKKFLKETFENIFEMSHVKRD